MAVVEIGRATGGTGIIFVVEAGVERDARGGGVIDGLRPSIGALQVEAVGEAMDQGGLERVVVRVGIGNEGLIGTGGETLKGRAGVGVRRGVLGNDELGAALRCDGNGILRAGELSEVAIAGFAQMQAMGADIAEVQDPASAEGALDGEIPLLKRRGDPLARHHQSKGANDVAGIAGRLRGVRGRGPGPGASGATVDVETLEEGRGRDKGGAELPKRRKKSLEKIGEAKGRHADGDRGREEGRREGHVVDSTDILAHAIDAEAAADGSGVVAADVVGEAKARLPDVGPVIVQAGGLRGSDKSRQVKSIYALGIEKWLASRSGEQWIGVADVAELVDRGTDDFVAQTQVEGQPLCHTEIILGKKTERRDVVIVVCDTAGGVRQEGLALQEKLEIGFGGSGRKKEQSVVRDGNIAAQGGAVEFTAKA